MSEFIKNLRNNQGYSQKQYDPKYKGQQRNDNRGKGGGKQTNDIPPYLKALFDDLAPVIKSYLTQAAESQARVAVAAEKNAQAIEKLMESLPELLQQTVPARREPRKRKITPRKQELLDLIKKLRDENMTYEEVAAYLQKNKIPTFSGRGRWHAQTIHRLYMYYP